MRSGEKRANTARLVNLKSGKRRRRMLILKTKIGEGRGEVDLHC